MKSRLPYAVAVVLLSVACEKSLSQQQREAQEAQKKADEETATALSDTRQKIEQARYEASKDMGAANKDLNEARREMNEKVNELATAGNESARKAQERAVVETQDVSNTLRKAGNDLRQSIEVQLNDIDKRVADARQLVGKKSGEAKVSSEKVLDDVTRKTESVRQNLRDFESTTVQSIESFSKQINDRLNELGKSLDRVEPKN